MFLNRPAFSDTFSDSFSEARPGFSLIELTVVVMILAVGATVALPRLAETVAGSRVQTVAKTIQCDLELARRTAMNRGRVVTVHFDWEAGTYQSTDVPVGTGHTLRKDLPEAFATQMHLTSDFDGATGIQFDHHGTPSMIDLDGTVQSTGNIEVDFDGEALNVQIRPGLSLITLGRTE